MNIRKLQSALIAIPVLLFACKKDKTVEIKTPEISATKGVYVLCEGSFATPNSSAITYYDIATNTTEANFYKKVNGTDLGSNANDLKAYGSKMYCVVTGTGANNTSFVDVISIATGKSLKRIAFNNAEPRSVAFANGKAYVSNYNGKISRIDTASMSVESELQLTNGTANASDLENVAVANGKLYVAGASGYLSTTSYNNKLIVINLSTFTKSKELTVNYNPQRLAVTENGDLFVLSWGDYNTVSAAIQKINTVTDEVAQTQAKFDLLTITANKAQVLASVSPYSAAGLVNTVNTATSVLGAAYITDGTIINTPYSLTINNFDNTVLVADADNYALVGKAYLFTADGKKKYNFNTGTNPQSAVFNYTYK